MPENTESPIRPQPWSSADGLFLLSCHRSGSTLLRYILDTHPEIYSPPETFLGPTAYHLSNFLSAMELNRAADDRPVPILDWIRQTLGDQMALQTARRKKRIWCEKTPDNLAHLALLDAVFPKARHLCLYRHALDVAHSGVKMIDDIPAFQPYLYKSQGHAVTALLRYWNERTRDLLHFEKARRPRCFHIHYETLVRDPRSVLEPLFGFLEVRWNPALLDSVFSSPHDVGAEDHYARFATRIYNTSLGAGRNLPLDGVPEADLQETRALLADLGYPPMPEPLEASESEDRGAESRDVRWLFESHLPQRLRTRRPGGRAAGSTYKFAVDGQEGGTWVLDLRRGTGEVKTGEGDAVCTIRVSASYVLELATGRLNPLKAFDEGTLKVQGRLDLNALREVFDLLRV